MVRAPALFLSVSHTVDGRGWVVLLMGCAARTSVCVCVGSSCAGCGGGDGCELRDCSDASTHTECTFMYDIILPYTRPMPERAEERK